MQRSGVGTWGRERCREMDRRRIRCADRLSSPNRPRSGPPAGAWGSWPAPSLFSQRLQDGGRWLPVLLLG